MTYYLSTIDRAQRSTQYEYAVGDLINVCKDILKNEHLDEDEKKTLEAFKKNLNINVYSNMWTEEVDFAELWKFQDLAKELWQYVCYNLGLN